MVIINMNCFSVNHHTCTCKLFHICFFQWVFCLVPSTFLSTFLLSLSLPVFVLGQVMVNSEVSGVAFSRHPLKPISAECTFVEAVFGLGEGLVSGELEADRYEVRRHWIPKEKG